MQSFVTAICGIVVMLVALFSAFVSGTLAEKALRGDSQRSLSPEQATLLIIWVCVTFAEASMSAILLLIR